MINSVVAEYYLSCYCFDLFERREEGRNKITYMQSLVFTKWWYFFFFFCWCLWNTFVSLQFLRAFWISFSRCDIEMETMMYCILAREGNFLGETSWTWPLLKFYSIPFMAIFRSFITVYFPSFGTVLLLRNFFRGPIFGNPTRTYQDATFPTETPFDLSAGKEATD